jgi:dTDP-4-dehydrorhamnose reductase
LRRSFEIGKTKSAQQKGHVVAKTICIIGSNGQLGTDLAEAFEDLKPACLTHADIEIRDPESIRRVLERHRPDAVLNTASFHNVPLCEEKPAAALAVNVEGCYNLARACAKREILLVHYSTDYVFDGAKRAPYAETDLPRPLNFYGVTKLAGEHAVSAFCPRSMVLRVSGIYGKVPCRAKGTNFVSTMLGLSEKKKEIRVVDDEILTPTSTRDIALQTRVLAEKPEPGLYHLSNAGQCSWYEFAREIFRLCGRTVGVVPVSSSHFPSPVRRPSWSVLDNARLKERGLYRMPHWKEALRNHLERLSLLSQEKQKDQESADEGGSVADG